MPNNHAEQADHGALYLIERYCGSQLAFETGQVVEHERRGVVWRAL